MKKTENIRYMTELAMLMALEVVMYLTPLGMLPLPGQNASLLTVPVAIGAMLLGPAAGGVLGFIFGILSFWTALKRGVLVGAGVGLGMIFVLCVVTRTLMGLLTGFLFRLVDKIDRTDTIDCFIGGLTAPVLNTLLYMSVYVIILMNNILLQNAISAAMGEQMVEKLHTNVFVFVAAYVGIQAVIEAAVGCVVGGGVCKALRVVLKR